MNKPHPPFSNNEMVTIPDAYAIIWRAGTVALMHSQLEPGVRSAMGDELINLFDKVDTARDDAAALSHLWPDGEIPHISLGSLLEGVDRSINDIYDQHSQEQGRKVNPFMVEDDRLEALMGLDVFVRAAKSSLSQPIE